MNYTNLEYLFNVDLFEILFVIRLNRKSDKYLLLNLL